MTSVTSRQFLLQERSLNNAAPLPHPDTTCPPGVPGDWLRGNGGDRRQRAGTAPPGGRVCLRQEALRAAAAEEEEDDGGLRAGLQRVRKTLK